MTNAGQPWLVIYAGTLTAIWVGAVLIGAGFSKKANFEEITVQRINVIEPNGTLRMIISDHARLPGIIVHGKERPFARPEAGMLFYNNEGSENGGLIFGGHRNAKGEIIDSGGSLSFDKYEANQIVQLAGVNDKDDKFAGLDVSDSATGGQNHSRVWVGTKEDGAATLALMDAHGKKRIVMQVTADGASRLSFLDSNGKIITQMIPSSTR